MRWCGSRRTEVIGVPIGEVIRIAERFTISVYDAAYVGLAEARRAELWTADRKLMNATAQGAPFVRWIGEYE
jgi:predicted nucleic acid-binding protein